VLVGNIKLDGADDAEWVLEGTKRVPSRLTLVKCLLALSFLMRPNAGAGPFLR
jgi:hypothetical protein